MSVPVDTTIFHICNRAALTAARVSGAYRAESLSSEGFIHLSRAHQVRQTARAYFNGVPDLVLLIIDPRLLGTSLVYEAPAPIAAANGTPKTASAPHSGDLYPHCYGPIPLDAILDVIDLERFDGGFAD